MAVRKISRGIVRGYVVELERQGLLPVVLPRLSDRTRVVVELGNAAPRWIEGDKVDDLLTAVAAVAGRDAVRELGRRAMKGAVGDALQPLISFVISFRDPDPAALFARAGGMALIVSEGTRLSWKRTGARDGVVTVEADDPTPSASLAAWEGALSYAFELTNIDGWVAPARQHEGGCIWDIGVGWKPAARQESR